MRQNLFAVLLAAATAFSIGPASAGFWEEYGPRESRAQPQAQQEPSSPWGSGGQVWQPSQQGSLAGGKFPRLMDGGGRPGISPEAPPIVRFSGYAPGNIVIDTRGRALYYVLPGNQAYRYPVAVGREGFQWYGSQKISRTAAWPDWIPPAEMRQRDPRLPERMTGGVRNPLGAMALYLGSTLYRIHGTNDARSIGGAASSGCFRMMNAHVLHLAQRAGVGTTVTVVRSLPGSARVAGL
jgi:lipoprotein-anchoring transpeptidase ErfK/SrfK